MRTLTSTFLLAGVLLAPSARAQSDRLLEAIRLERPAMRSIAETELVACAQKKECADRDALNLLTAVLALKEGDHARAATLLRAQSGPAGLEAYRAYYLGVALLRAGTPVEAAQAFVAAEKGPSVLAARARAKRAEALSGSGKFEQAQALLPGTLPSPELIALRARARQALGNTKGEIQDLRELLLRFPVEEEAKAAEARLNAIAPKAFTFDERLERSRAFVAAGKPELALLELNRLEEERPPQDDTVRGKLALARANALFAKNDVAAGQTQLAIAGKGDRPTALQAAMVAARRAMYEDNDKARNLYIALEQKFSRDPGADDGAFYIGWIEIYSSRFDSAIADFERFEKAYPKSAKLEEVRWYKGFCQILLERYADAKKTLAGVGTKPGSIHAPQARYWSARADQLAGQPAPAVVSQYKKVISTFPGSFYAILAAERLHELGQEPVKPFPTPTELKTPVPANLQTAFALAKAGLYEDSGELVDAEIAHVKSPAQAISLGHAFLRFGEFGSAYRLAARVLEGQNPAPKSADALALLYPRAFRTHVERAAQSQQIDPAYIWSTMRRESSFRAEHRSTANAYGLMQILPQTATKISKALNEPAPDPEELYLPALNIKLGAWYLGALNKRFGHPALVAAAYNAGPPIAVKWFNDFGTLPLDQFVEMIPYRETRGYMRQLMADSMNYHLIYEKKAPRLPMKLPAPRAGVDF